MPPPALPPAAVLHVPDWLWGSDPQEFYRRAAFHARISDRDRHLWRVQTLERYEHRQPDLIRADQLAGPGMPRTRFDQLARWDARFPADPPRAEVAAEQARLAALTAAPSARLAPGLVLLQLNTFAASNIDVATVARETWDTLRKVPFGDPPEPAFPDASVHYLRRADPIMHRAKMPSVWLRVDQDPSLREGKVDHLYELDRARDDLFPSSFALYDGMALLDIYFAVLLGCLSPAVWAFTAPRASGTVIYSLGRPIDGTSGTAAEPLQLVPSRGPNEVYELPVLAPAAAPAAIDWWSRTLNDFFGVLTDPAVFTDASGTYVPVKHLQTILTVEQLFARTSAIQTSHRLAAPRRALLFTVLDTLERLTGRPFEELSSHRRAARILDELTVAIPEPAAQVLLPAARRAVDALAGVQHGFYLRRQRGTDTVDLIDRTGATNSLTPDRAAADYLKVLRNATHGHGSKHASNRDRTNALLAQHTGTLSHDLPLLGYLYLLELLTTDADHLRRRLYASGAT